MLIADRVLALRTSSDIYSLGEQKLSKIDEGRRPVAAALIGLSVERGHAFLLERASNDTSVRVRVWDGRRVIRSHPDCKSFKP